MPHVSHASRDEGAPTRAVVATARRQHGRIATAQLADLGCSAGVVGRWVAAGWLVREHRGVYRLAGTTQTALARGVAAVLSVDPRGSVTHRSGLVLHRVLDDRPDLPVHLTTARHHRSRRGIVVHQASLAPNELVRIDGLSVASLTRCLIDTAAVEPEWAVREAVREAEFRRCLDAPALLAAAASRPRAALLRALAAERLPIRGELVQDFERRFARFLAGRDFPVADVNQRLVLHAPRQIVRLDVVWWEAGLALELDGRQAHATSQAFDDDRERDRRLAVQFGLRVVRVTWKHLGEKPDALDHDLKTLYARGVAARRAS